VKRVKIGARIRFLSAHNYALSRRRFEEWRLSHRQSHGRRVQKFTTKLYVVLVCMNPYVVSSTSQEKAY
jgi:hypothetical protein